jgi:tRNA (guanine37-N1)-methyltransferase
MQDSFGEIGTCGLLDCPHYTRPQVYRGAAVPEVLMSGHHANIVRWRRGQALANTLKKRPDLIDKARSAGKLTNEDEKHLDNLNSPYRD